MNVLEFIREKREDFQENTAQFKAMLEPTFQSWSNKLNDRIGPEKNHRLKRPSPTAFLRWLYCQN